MSKPLKNIQKKDILIERSLVYSIMDGAFFSMMMGFGEYYIGAYALLLGATGLQIGLFGSIPNFLGYFAQIFAPNITRFFGSRKRTIVIASIVRTILWIVIMLAWLFGVLSVWLIILATSIYFSMIYIGSVPWTSWMGDLVDEKERNNYFAKRNKVSNILMMFGIILGGIVLEISKTVFNSELMGFSIIFIIALLSSIISVIFLSMKKDIPYVEKEKDSYTLWNFTKNLKNDKFGKFTIFQAVMYFGIYVSSPFFVAYQIRVIGMNYIEIMITQAVFLLSKALFFKPWSALTKKYCNIKALALSAMIVAILPFTWYLVKDSMTAYIVSIISGIGWAGFELLAFNYIYDTVIPKRRAKATSYMSFYRGIAIILGGIVGTILFLDTSSEFKKIFMSILAISGFFRILSIMFFIKEIKTLKYLKPVQYSNMFIQLITSYPRDGINYITEFTKKKK